ncbi:hypothetical protein BN8_03957 [Fibrisoma limi BUZ 3]|uniref:Uncharacterized protein n=1 Tax=Fibrisoma limi BUZ 3 TaxID=1185876 RepID=I2GLH9_9BACT|nr:hypothetical protein BN8_03957 [Fibrisoma limi BUZ 3]
MVKVKTPVETISNSHNVKSGDGIFATPALVCL